MRNTLLNLTAGKNKSQTARQAAVSQSKEVGAKVNEP